MGISLKAIWGRLTSPNAVPGIATALTGAFAPLAAWNALWTLSARVSAVKTVLDDAFARAVINQFFQFTAVFSSCLISLVTAIVFLASRRLAGGWFKRFIIFSLVACAVIFVVLFASGGAAWFPLIVEEGPFTIPSLAKLMPPVGHPFTWIRVFLIAVGGILSVSASRYLE